MQNWKAHISEKMKIFKNQNNTDVDRDIEYISMQLTASCTLWFQMSCGHNIDHTVGEIRQNWKAHISENIEDI